MTNHCPTTGLRAIADAAETRQDLLAWYDRQQRDLPWRRERDPYRVWVSEVMLQQTRVETVLPYYERWMKRFPTLDDLADADPEDVLRAWSGLGYYARARNLHRAAMTVRERHGAVLPNDAARLRELPGVGAYTAGAVASIAFGRPEPAVDGNARRVLCRLFDLASPSAAELFRRAAALVDPDRPGDFNQALMELGATVCRPRAPRCARCPLARGCRARARGTAEYRPRARSGGPVPAFRVGTAVVVSSMGRFLLGRRPPRGLLGGLWEFPGAVAREGERPRAAGRRALAAALGRAARRVEALPGAIAPILHAYSHRRHEYCAFRYRSPIEASGAPAGRRGAPGMTVWTETAWVEPAGLADFPLSAAQRRIAAEAVQHRARERRLPMALAAMSGPHSDH